MSARRRWAKRARESLGLTPVPTDPDMRFQQAVEAKMQSHSDVEAAARHLLETMSLIGSDGKALFSISDENDAVSADLLRHAVINLQATLAGAELPSLALPREMH